MHYVSLTMQKRKFYKQILKHLVAEELYEDCATVRDVIEQIDPEEFITIDDIAVLDENDEEEE
jgi:protein-arginine kinase activator protein McsA